ncbi:hypothetical protein MNBD_GAMMA15-1649 [hydrothermal vent metagenome]|uniref:DUF922 domain-containing protein n=1 Tax=hydrothermal vent metagenome TaxID=652676 RepID=A0A3B0YLJ7_9ZZZZ
MAGFRTQGPLSEELLVIEETRGVHGRHAVQGPIGAGSGGQHKSVTTGSTLSGWPRDITWKEFREINSRPEGEEEDAEIKVDITQPKKINIKRDHDTDELYLSSYTAKIKVTRKKSWAVKGEKTDALLAHEQVHFDIAGLAGRDMVRKLAALRTSSADELQAEVSTIIQKSDDEMSRISDLYDSFNETDHGRKHAAQDRWEHHIHHLIEANLPLSPVGHG